MEKLTFLRRWASVKNIPEDLNDSELIVRFLEQKKQLEVEDRKKVFKNYGPESLGGETWVIGLLGMMYDKTNTSKTLMSDLARQLLSALKELSEHKDAYENYFYLKSILKALLDRANTFDQRVREEIVETIKELKLVTHVKKDIRLMSRKVRDYFKPNVMPLPFGQLAKEEKLSNDQNQNDDRLSLFSRNVVKETLKISVTNTNQIAFVLHSSAVVSDYVKARLDVRFIDMKPLHWIREFINVYQQLMDQGFGTIYTILPSAKYWAAVQYAKHASYKLEEYIKVIDTQNYGLALGMMMDDLLSIKDNTGSTTEMVQRIETMVEWYKETARYWVVVDQIDEIKEQFWFRRVQAQSEYSLEDFDNKKMILSLHSPIKILDVEENIEGATKKIMKFLGDECRQLNKSVMKIKIECRGLFLQAERMKSALQKAYKDVQVDILAASN